MSSIRAFSGKTEILTRPGHSGDAQAESFKDMNVGSAEQIIQRDYVTWSGTTATVHHRLMFDTSGNHGFGAEFA